MLAQITQKMSIRNNFRTWHIVNYSHMSVMVFEINGDSTVCLTICWYLLMTTTTKTWKLPITGACPTKYLIDQIRSNSNYAWNSYRCAFEDNRPIITTFGTRHDSGTVVTCTKFRYDRPTFIEIRGTRIFSKFWIRSNLSIRYLVGQAPGPL